MSKFSKLGKILVIEDDEDIRAVLSEVIANWGFDVVCAENGAMGVKLALRIKPDLILCDAKMPQMDGYEVLTTLRKNPIMAGVPFIFLTGNSEREEIRHGMKLGADDYLTKPFTFGEVLSAIQTRLERKAEFEKAKLIQNVAGVEVERLEQALQQSEFVLHYQPQVNLSTGQVIGVEALLRWQHPDRGLLGPDEVIPLAEQTGLIIEIGEWVLRTACQQLKAWHQLGFSHLRMAVNVSSIQLEQPTFCRNVENIISEVNLDFSCIELEITESVIVQEFSHHVFHSLKKSGIKIAIDDFGTGYSSLLYLKNFPFDTLKIDRIFVQDVPKDRDNLSLINSMLQIAKNFNLSVVAEGVETEAEYEFLRNNGCHAAQGYFMSRPLPADKFKEFLLKSLPHSSSVLAQAL
jgi:EAL domain-containing protein (putative c-di-GMP-specific phosphodiesterase class I)/CheY-like chemotaxis protein